MTRVFITGTAGFIGFHLARLLLDAAACDLEIEAASLEHAFLALTADQPVGV